LRSHRRRCVGTAGRSFELARNRLRLGGNRSLHQMYAPQERRGTRVHPMGGHIKPRRSS
jgi:hypothetical protein